MIKCLLEDISESLKWFQTSLEKIQETEKLKSMFFYTEFGLNVFWLQIFWIHLQRLVKVFEDFPGSNEK